MQQHKSIIVISVFLLIFTLLFTNTLASSGTNISQTGATVEIIADNAENLSAAGARVFVSGTVQHDMWLAGASIDVDATAGGDLHAAGARVIFRGMVDGVARLAGAEVLVDGEIAQQLNAVGASVVVSENSSVGAYSSMAGALVEFHGTAQNTLELYGDEVLFDGQTTGSLIIEARSVDINSEAVIGGDLEIRSVEKTEVPESVSVDGNITLVEITEAEYNERDDVEDTLFGDFGGKLLIGASAFLLGLLLILFTRNTTDQMTGLLRAHPGKSILWGLAIFFGLPLTVFFCLVSVIGIPIGLTSLLLIPFLILLGFTSAILGLSDLLLSKSGRPRKTGQRILFLALSVLVYYAIRLVPVFGAIVVFIAMLFGLGAAIVTIGERLKGPDKLTT